MSSIEPSRRRCRDAVLSLALLAGVLALSCVLRPPVTPPPVEVSTAIPSLPLAPEDPPDERVSAPEPPQSPAPAPSSPAARPDPLFIPEVVRVGLATDLEEVALPCCGHHLELVAGELRASLERPATVRPGAALEGVASYRLQVAALRDQVQAAGLARRLQDRLGVPGDATFDAELGLYRVRVGSYPDRSQAEGLSRELRALGVTDVWVVQEGGSVKDPAFVLFQDGAGRRLPGRWLALESDEGFVRIRGGGYRGRILLYLNDRGRLNMINELSLDDYLRGVVPREMGPEIYDEIEVLKALTVAARTYTLRNLGEFGAEGYDICATPRCQVYGGLDVEHRLSNRAVDETRGQVLLYEGELADTLYSATCGGHTENVEVVFPLRHEPYLRGVPCTEAGEQTLASRRSDHQPLAPALMRTLLPPAPAGSEAAVVGGRLEHLALLAGLEPPTARLRSLEPREVQRYVSSLFDLALDARLLLPRQELQAVLESPPEVWGASERRLAQRLGAEEELLRGEAAEELLLDLSLALGVVRVMEAAYVGQERGRLEVRSGGETRRLPLSPTLATYAARGSQTVAGDLALRPGDRLQLYLRRGDVLALRQSAHRADLFAEDLPYRSWSRFRTAGEVRSAVRERYPGFDLRSFEVTERGVSGRVARLRLLGTHGDELFLEGLQVRWTLGLPDTLFTVRPLSRHEGSEGWLFEGRGWGHGVGLCQVGAFGMAQRGHHYDEILDYYYSGVHLVRVSTPPRVVVAAAGAPKSH